MNSNEGARSVIEDAFPLAMLQQGMLFHSALDARLGVYHDVFSYEMETAWDMAVFEKALDMVVARHGALRTVYRLDGARPLQVVMAHKTPFLEVVDLRSCDQAEKRDMLTAWVTSEKSSTIDTAKHVWKAYVHLLDEFKIQFGLSFHHALWDGWSVANFVSELFVVYAALLKGETVVGGEKPPSYRNFVALEQQALNSAENKIYWANKMRHVRTPWWTGEKSGQSLSFLCEISKQQSESIIATAGALDVAEKSVWCAVYMALIAILDGSLDVVGSVATHGRPELPNADKMLGLFLNTLPLRVNLENLSWRELVKLVDGELREQYAYRHHPLVDVQNQTGLDFSGSMFGYLNFHVYGESGVKSKMLGGQGFEETNYRMVVSVQKLEESRRHVFRINADATPFDAVYQTHIRAYVRNIVDGLTSGIDRPINMSALIGRDERLLQLKHWNQGKYKTGTARTLMEALAEKSRSHGAAIALRQGEAERSYSELEEQTNQMAHYLRAQGLQRHDVAAVRLRPSIECVTVLLGLLKLGCSYVLIDSTKSLQRQSWMVKNAGAGVRIDGADTASPLPGISTEIKVITFDGYAHQGQPIETPTSRLQVEEGDIAVLCFGNGEQNYAHGFSHAGVLQCALAGAQGATPNLEQIGGLDSYSLALWSALLAGNAVDPSDLPVADSVTAPQHIPAQEQTCEFYVLAGSDIVPIGTWGELCIGGAAAAQIVRAAPGHAAALLLPHPFSERPGERLYATGLRARYHSNGDLDIEPYGVIPGASPAKSRALEQTERALRQQPGLEDVALERESSFGGPGKIVAYCVLTEGVEVEAASASLLTALRRRLPFGLLPSAIVRVAHIPRHANGTADFTQLASPYQREGQEDHEWPVGPCEELLAGIWTDLLQCGRVSRHANFFELGGYSLIGMQLVARIRNVFGIELPLRDVFERKDLQSQALLIQQAQQQGKPLAVLQRVDRTAALPLSFSQQRLWFLSRMMPPNAVYNISVGLRLRGKLDEAALVKALATVVARHEALRTRFGETDGQAVQIIDPVPPASTCVTLADVESEEALRNYCLNERGHCFDLGSEPLYRLHLLHLLHMDHDGQRVLHATFHHIVFDGWSVGVFFKEVVQHYRATLAGLALPPAPAIQYADYAHWQREQLTGEVIASQLQYWETQLSGLPPLLELPTDRPRPAEQSYRGATAHIELDQALVEGLASLCRAGGSTLFMSLISVFAVLLARYAGQDDIAIGTPVANRGHSETEELIGFFLNSLVLRFDLSGKRSFKQLLGSTREMALQAYAHQDIPFEHLVEHLNPARSLSHAPLFQVSCSLVNTPVGGQMLSGIDVEPLQFAQEEGVARYDLTFNFSSMPGGGLFGSMEYNTDLFDASTIARMLGHYRCLLEAAVADPDMIVRDLPMLEEAERQQLLVEWNGTGEAYPREQTIHQLFEQQVGKTPGKVAVVFEEETLSYAELNARANRLAHYLRSQGVGPDVLVGICVERSLDMIVGLLAILKAGGAYVPLDPAYPQDRLATMLDDAKPAVLLTQEHLRGTLPSDVATFCLDSQWPELEAKDTNPEHQTQAGNLAYVIYTSGSTGKPKGALLQHYNVTRLFLATEDKFHFSQADTWTMFHSYAFDFSVWEIWGALLYGGKLIVVPYLLSRSTEQFHALLAQEQVTILNQTPSAFRQLMEVDLKQADPTNPADHPALHLRHVIFGGEALNASMLTPWVQKHGAAGPGLINMYGITETTVHVTYLQVQDDTPSAASIGRPISDLSAFILDGAMNPVPIGVAGELHIAGDGLARGYLNLPGLTAERFVANPYGSAGSRMYKSGDLARYLPDGSIEYLGRIDSQVKIRGFRIEPGEIEAALTAQEDVSEALVLAREDEGGKRLVAYVVAEEQATVDGAQLREVLLQSLPDYMVPSYFVMLERFPLTSNGKIDRKALPAPEMRRSVTGYVAPVTPAERILAGIWAEVLKLDKVGIHDNFFALGGDSMLTIAIASKARLLGLSVTLELIFKHQTIADLVEALPAAASIEVAPSGADSVLVSAADLALLPDGVENAYGLSRLQLGMVFHNQFSQELGTYHDLFSYTLKIVQWDSEIFQIVLDALVAKHPILRTSFDLNRYSEPLQLVHRQVSIPVTEFDLTSLESLEQDELIANWIEGEKKTAFNLEQPPLLRIFIHHRAADVMQYTLSFHHAILDGWSVASLQTELFREYARLSAKKEKTLSLRPLASSFKNVVAQEARALQSDQTKSFWRGYLAGHTLSGLPSLRKEEGAASINNLSVPISAELRERLAGLANALCVPLRTVLLSAHMRVMSMLSGKQDVLTGQVSHSRPEEQDGEQILGLFLNTLPFRQILHPKSWKDLVKATFEAELEIKPHRSYPYAQLFLDNERVPLFETAFNYVNFHVYDDLNEVDDFKVLGGQGFEATNFAFMFSVVNRAGSLVLSLSSDPLRLSAAQLEPIALYYQSVLQAMVADPAANHAAQDYLSAAERRQLLVQWNETESELVGEATLPRLFEVQVAKSPDSLAAVFDNEQLTYAQLNARANRLAHYLRAAGVGPDVLVGICVDRSLDLIVGLLGILKAGGAYVPLDPAYPAQRLRAMLEDAQPAIVLTQQKLVQAMPVGGVATFCLDSQWTALPQNETNPTPAARAGNLAYVIYTSGSTGRPKGVGIQQQSVCEFIEWSRAFFDEESMRHVLASTSMCFDLSVFEMFVPLCRGGSMWVVRNILDLLQQPAAGFPITMINTVPSAIAEVHRSGAIPKTVKVINLAGEALQNALVQSLYRSGCAEKVFNLYGPSEDTTYSTGSLTEYGLESFVTIGRPISNTQTYILDELLNLVPAGVAGELHIAGAGLARGYLKRPELTAEKFVPNPWGKAPGARMYKTGDLARYLPDGNIDYLGRIDNQVKIRGFRIELGEIESQLSRHPSVKEAVVVAREDASGEKRLVAYLTLQAESAVDVGDLRIVLRNCLPDYMMPAYFVTLDALPLTPNGKVDRKALPAPEARRSEGGYIAPRTPVEEILAGIWAEVLKLDKVGVEDNFFELGGHSLLATQLASKVRAVFATEVPLRALFEAPTVALLAQRMAQLQEEQGALAAPAIVPVERNGEQARHWPLSYAQQRLWFLEQFEPGQAFYNMPAALRLNGNLNVAALSDTFNEILRRHEALRTSFAMVDDSPMQVINPSLTLSLPVLDLSSVLPAEREAQAHWLAQDEAQTAFDLSNGPLIRGRLIKLAQDEHILLFTMHHIVSDGWSMTVLVNELASLYAAFAAGQASPLAELPIQYADYALWQRQWLSGDVLEQQLRYWQGQLTGAPTLLSLPTDRPRPMVQSHRGATKGFRIEAASTASLLSLCKQTQSTLFMSLAAVFNILLCRYAQQNDICLGTVIANRNRGEVEGLIGFFVNTLVLRTQVDGLERFSDLLKRVRSTALEAYAHQDVPFEQLVEAVKPERHTSHSPLFQVMLVLQNTPKGALTLPQLTLQPVVTERTSSKFDLTLYATEGSTELQCAFEYNTDLFDEATVERMARHFTTLLQAAVADPDMIVRDLPMLEEAERQQLLVEWNGTAQDYAGERTVHQLFEAQAAKTPDSAALVFEDRALTYAEVNARANRLAHHLRGQGVGPDVLVGLCMERAPDMIVGLLGILKAGGAYVPLDPAYPQDRLAYMLEDAQPALLLTQARYRDTLPGNVATFCLDSQWQELETNDTNPENRTQAGNLAYVIYTSGSTGKPKGVLGSVGGLRNRLMWMQASFPYGAGTNYLQKTSISFIDSLTETLGPLLFGGCLHIAGSAIAGDPQRLGQLIEREQIARLVLVPSLLKSMVQSEEGGIKSGITPGLDMIVCSGEALPSSLAQLCRDTSILNLYGSSEGTGDSTWHLCDGTSSDRDMIPIGRPIANTEIYLLDSAHNPVPVGVAGELHIAGAGLARGYLNRAGLTAEKFVPNPYGKTAGARMYRTGDLARYLPDGSIDYLGRIDNQVKVRGFRIELGEIESALRAAEQVAEAVVVAREDEPGDKRLVAYVVPASLDESQLRQALQQHLPDYMVPAYFVTLDALPLTPNGKVDRKALPAPEVRRSEGGYIAPRTPVEEILAGIWAEVLKLDKVGVEDNFFELGGHSLLATQVMSKIRSAFQIDMPLRTLFEANTIEKIRSRIDYAKWLLDSSTNPAASHDTGRDAELDQREEI